MNRNLKYLIIICVLYLLRCNSIPDHSSNTPIEKPDSFIKLECEKWGRQTKDDLGDDYHVLVSSPFVISGNMSLRELKKYNDATIQAAYKALYKKFFTKLPTQPIRILLFFNEQSYKDVARQLYGDSDVSTFGYYRPSERTMLMNIATGKGTLVHELTHALMFFDFPDAPVWFEEAMGTLFEQCSIVKGEIKGHKNWRYPVLRNAVDNDQIISLEKLLFTTYEQIEGRQSSLICAEVRYLAFYLQEKNLLEKFYQLFQKQYSSDPSGSEILEKVTQKSLGDLQEDWIQWLKVIGDGSLAK